MLIEVAFIPDILSGIVVTWTCEGALGPLILIATIFTVYVTDGVNPVKFNDNVDKVGVAVLGGVGDIVYW